MLALAILAVCGLGLWRRARGILWRSAMLALGLLALANPVVIREQREPLDDIALLLVDRSPSQTVGDAAAAARSGARASCARELGQIEGLEVVETTTAGDGKGGTRLFETLGNEPARDRPRAAARASLMLSDGQVHDVPDEPRGARHRRADPPAADRRAGRARPPAAWSSRCRTTRMVGDQEEITLRVDELPAGGAGEPVTVTLRQDGELRQRLTRAGPARRAPCRSS